MKIEHVIKLLTQKIKQMRLRYLYILMASLGLVFGCDNYLDVAPKGLVIPSEIKDYDLLLNGGDNTIHTTADENALFLTADDWHATEADLGDLTNPNNDLLKLFKWDSELYLDQTEEPYSWKAPYKNIFTYNLIINEVDEAIVSGKYKAADKAKIKAEAKLGRAYEYWLLVNTFAKQYQPATAASDPGVPLVITADASAKTPERASVQEVYDFIITETKGAIADLPDVRANKIRFSKGAGYALLARFYLAMANYQEALVNADKAIKEKGEIGDYTAADKVIDLYYAEQYVYRMYQYTRGFTTGQLSTEIAALYDAADTRLTKVLNNCGWEYSDKNGWEYICGDNYRNAFLFDINHSVSVPEMYLIRAECYARDANTGLALNDVNLLRSKRIPADNYVEKTESDFSSETEVLRFVLNERRREMVMTGMRLFDLKRLNVESDFAKSVSHTVANETHTLAPGSNNLVLPIPAQVLNFNPNMAQNPRD